MYTNKEIDLLCDTILEAAAEVHRLLGPGLIESVYETCLCKELEIRKINFQRQVLLPIQYKKFQLDTDYKIDIMVENEVLVELESSDELLPEHEAQLLTFLKLTKKRLGLLINFNTANLSNGFKKLAFQPD